MNDSVEVMREREQDERMRSVQAMAAKEADKECLKSSEYHVADRLKSVGYLMKHKASELSHQHKADRELQRITDLCHQTGQPVDASTTTATTQDSFSY